MKKYFSAIIAVSLFSSVPFAASAAHFDLMMVPDVIVKPAHPLVFTTVKIYVTVDNKGSEDVEGMVIFRDGDVIIGQKSVSVKAGGNPEDMWLNWKPTTPGTHTIEIQAVNDAEYPEATPGDNVTTKKISVTSVIEKSPATVLSAVAPIVSNASSSATDALSEADAIAQSSVEYIVASSTSPTTSSSVIVTVTSSTDGSVQNSIGDAKSTTTEEKGGRFDMTSIVLWPIAGLFGLITIVAFFIAHRKAEEL